MPIDSSLFQNQNGIDAIGSIQRGLQIADQIEGRKAKRAQSEKNLAIQEAYKAGVTQNPDGTFTFDKKKSLGEIAKLDGQLAMQLDEELRNQEAQQQKNQFENQKNMLDLTGRYIGAAKANPQAWPQIRADFIAQTKSDPASIPESYDPKWIAQQENMVLTADQRRAQGNSDRDFNLKEQEIALKRTENAIKKEELKLKNKDFERLPEEDREVVKTLASTNGKVKAIVNNINSSLESWDTLKDTDKVAKGRLLLKVLNSPLGADAIGSEEAKRLGGKLEFAMSNISNSNPTQFGRDLKGFKDDSLELAKSLERAIKQNEDVIKDRYSKVGVSKDIGSKEPDAETKEINGATYVKTQGGWKLSKVANK